jgi:hypothetical protein
VILKGIIRRDGTVDSFKVIKGLGRGLDALAIRTIAAKWRFKPGTIECRPVDVVANVEVRFRMFLRKFSPVYSGQQSERNGGSCCAIRDRMALLNPSGADASRR